MKTKKKAKTLAPKIAHKLGDRHFIDGIDCTIRYLNAGMAWAFPTTDCEDEPLIARHIAFAKIEADGKVVVL